MSGCGEGFIDRVFDWLICAIASDMSSAASGTGVKGGGVVELDDCTTSCCGSPSASVSCSCSESVSE